MMTLPKFDNPHPTREELFAEQKRLQEQTDKVLNHTGLLNILAQYGTNQPIEGSYEYGLMIYPDIDLSVLVESFTKQDFGRLVGELASKDFVRKIGTADTVNFSALHRGRPKGYWLGLDIPFENDRWGVDIWVQQYDWLDSNPTSYTARLSDLSDNQKEAILRIKYYLIREGLYGKQYFSGDVYDAVLDKGILSIKDFLHR